MKKESLDIARERAIKAGVEHMLKYVRARVENFQDDFNIGVALHACGEATDIAHVKCLEKHASYVLASCCLGKIQHACHVTFPRSSVFRSILDQQQYLQVRQLLFKV